MSIDSSKEVLVTDPSPRTRVGVDLVALTSAWQEDSDQEVRVLLRSDGAWGPDSIPRLAEAVLQAGQDAQTAMGEDVGELCGADRPVLSAEGPVFPLSAPNPKALTTYLDLLSRRFSAAGVVGEMVLAPDVVAQWWTAGEDTTHDRGYAVILALSGWTERRGRLHTAYPAWSSGGEIAAPLTAWTVDWLNGLDGPQFLHANGLNLVPPEQMPTLLHAVLADPQAVNYLRVDSQSAAGATRTVRFTMLGHLILHERCTAQTVGHTRAAVIDHAMQLAHRCDYAALLATGTAPPDDLYGALRNARHVRLPHYYTQSRYLDRQNLPDAFEWQIVTGQHLSRAESLDRWTLTDLGAGMHQLTTTNPAAWAAPAVVSRGGYTAPPEEVLTAARDDFGYLILGANPARTVDEEPH